MNILCASCAEKVSALGILIIIIFYIYLISSLRSLIFACNLLKIKWTLGYPFWLHTYSPSMSPNVCLSFSKRTFLSFLIFSLVTHPLSSSALVFLSYLILFCDKLSSCLNGLDGRVCLIIHMFFSIRSPEAKLVNLEWESSEVEFKRPIYKVPWTPRKWMLEFRC